MIFILNTVHVPLLQMNSNNGFKAFPMYNERENHTQGQQFLLSNCYEAVTEKHERACTGKATHPSFVGNLFVHIITISLKGLLHL